MTVGKDPGDSTMIRLNLDVKAELESEKIIPRESLNDCTKRLICENRQLKQELPTTQTRLKMMSELVNFVLNPDIPDTGHNHREIWKITHPGEILTSEDFIHHINGNHNDNRPENLLKVSAKEHAIAHAELRKQNDPLKTALSFNFHSPASDPDAQ